MNDEVKEEEFSVWKTIFRHLESEGYDVYPPGIKEGEVTDVYLVVRNEGATEVFGYSTDSYFYDIMLYYPRNRYSDTDILVRQLKESMDKLFPLVRPTRTIDAPFWDYEINGWQVSVEYVNYAKSKRR